MTAPSAEPHDPYVPIGCADYEHIELVCQDRYLVDVVTNETVVRGLAVDTMVNNQGEFLVVCRNDGTREMVRADHIKKIVALSADRRFDEYVFEGPPR